MTSDDTVYWSTRAAKQRALAQHATNAKVAATHNELAWRLDRMAEACGQHGGAEPALAAG